MIEIKVGDYVETDKGEIGYIISIENDLSFTWKPTNSEYNRYSGNQRFFKVNFKRIGINDFTDKDNKIEPIKYDGETMYTDNSTFNMPRNIGKTIITLMDKINEIIEYINKEEK